MAQPQPPIEDLARAARRDVKRLASLTRQAVRSLARLEDGLRQHGIDGIDVQDNGTDHKEH